MAKKIALITGITGQDGAYLAKLLLKKNYIVHGIKRRTSLINTKRIDDIYEDKNVKKSNFILHYGDVSDGSNINNLISSIKPNEIYNLAAQSHVQVSFQTPIYTTLTNAIGTLNILESIKSCKLEKKTKFYQASTSEMFGKMIENPANENTPFYPRSPYGVAKLYAHWMTKNYRESYDMFNVSGILFNHESERRGIEFVTRKISNGVAKIYLGHTDHISLGNLDSKRDWGYAPDYVESMWKMMQHETPEDFVVATGTAYSIRDFLDIAFKWVGIDSWEKHIKQDPRFMRPAEVDVLRGDSSKARDLLDWKPKTSFDVLVQKMVDNDVRRLQNET